LAVEKNIGAGRMAQVVECLPNKCEALHSSLSTTKKRKKKIFIRELPKSMAIYFFDCEKPCVKSFRLSLITLLTMKMTHVRGDEPILDKIPIYIEMS
jgi:hypothetical protein